MGAGALVEGTGETAVAQLVDPSGLAHVREDAVQVLPGRVVEDVAGARRHGVGDLGEFVGGVGGEPHPHVEPGGQSCVGGQEAVHLGGVSRQHHHQSVAVVLGAFEQGLDGLGSERVAAAVAGVDQ